jgi:D-alanyl-D-alanine carboxypeptidase (penicillin-binding protein 5/6)
MKVTLTYDKPVPAPIAKGAKLGTLIVTAPETTAVEVPLLAATGVDRMGPLGRMAMVAAQLVWNRH